MRVRSSFLTVFRHNVKNEDLANVLSHLSASVHDPFKLIPGLAGDPQRLAFEKETQSKTKTVLEMNRRHRCWIYWLVFEGASGCVVISND